MTNGAQNITYRAIANMVVDACANNCINLSGKTIPAGYANGYSATETITVTHPSNEYLRLTRTTANSVVSVAKSTIETDMNNFLNSTLGISAFVNYNINNINYLNFLIDMAIFYTTKMCLVMSNNNGALSNQMTSSTPNSGLCRFAYISTNSNFGDVRALDKTKIKEYDSSIYTLSEINSQIQTLISAMANMTRRTADTRINLTISM